MIRPGAARPRPPTAADAGAPPQGAFTLARMPSSAFPFVSSPLGDDQAVISTTRLPVTPNMPSVTAVGPSLSLPFQCSSAVLACALAPSLASAPLRLPKV